MLLILPSPVWRTGAKRHLTFHEKNIQIFCFVEDFLLLPPGYSSEGRDYNRSMKICKKSTNFHDNPSDTSILFKGAVSGYK